ncbi:MAG: host attachment protein [Rhodovibrionaceae bacterium]|nr:host attachment protein [Rhodovibrionaceae bacterium]
MKPIRTWILVADGEHARFLENMGPGKGLQDAPLKDMDADIPQSREIVTDRPGRSFDSHGQGRHAMEPIQYRRFEEQRFAGEVAQILDKAAATDSFDRLVLVAPPKTLGDLRKKLNDNTTKLVHAEIDKDLVNAPDEHLHKNLGEVMAI